MYTYIVYATVCNKQETYVLLWAKSNVKLIFNDLFSFSS